MMLILKRNMASGFAILKRFDQLKYYEEETVAAMKICGRRE